MTSPLPPTRAPKQHALAELGELAQSVLQADSSEGAIKATLGYLADLPTCIGAAFIVRSPTGADVEIATNAPLETAIRAALLPARGPVDLVLSGMQETVWAETPKRMLRQFSWISSRIDGLAVLPVGRDARFGCVLLAFDRLARLAPSRRSALTVALQLLAVRLGASQTAQDAASMAVRAASIADAVDQADVLSQIAEVCVPDVSDWVAVHIVRGDRLERVLVSHVEPDKHQIALHLEGLWPYSVDGASAVSRVFRDGEPIRERFSDPPHEDLHPELQARLAYVSLGGEVVRHYQLRGADRKAFGVMSFGLAVTPEGRSDLDHEAVAQILTHASAALSASYVADSQRRLALTLQRAALPLSLPQSTTWEIASRYVTAETHAVGGDWYDVVETEQGLVFVVGDVSGHGLEAATTMSQLRNAMRAYIVEGHPPAEVLSLSNAFLHHAGQREMATAMIVQISHDGKYCSAARAGHPPLVHGSFADARPLGGDPAPPLGAFPYVAYTDTRADIAGDDVLVLYTDGVVERVGEALDVGVARLRDVIADFGSGSASALADHLLDGMRDGVWSDDTCLLVLTRTKAEIWQSDFSFAPTTANIAAARDHVRAALERAGITSADVISKVELAASELSTNAIEATRSDDEIVLHVRVSDHVELSVLNVGRPFGQPEAPSDPLQARGRGLTMVKAMADELVIGHDGARSHVTARFELTN